MNKIFFFAGACCCAGKFEAKSETASTEKEKQTSRAKRRFIVKLPRISVAVWVKFRRVRDIDDS